jgi:hypothetical protein
MATTLVIDTGVDIVGVYSVADGVYTPYRGPSIRQAIARIQQADVVVTYNGNRYDLQELAGFAGLEAGKQLQMRGKHVDMREVCWPGILGSNLSRTYSRHLTDVPAFPDTYEGSNQLDVYMTFKLWELWELGKLKDIHGCVIPPTAT